MNKIGIVVVATNSYFVLGIRFVKKFQYYYTGTYSIKFFFFSDVDPGPYLPEEIDVEYHQTHHTNWLDATNSKFLNIISLDPTDCDYLYYFDADTNIYNYFDENWFIGDMVGGEHFGNRDWLKNGAGFDKNPNSKAYVPPDTTLTKIYYYGAFFGGKSHNIFNFCRLLREWQLEDKKIPYEPGVNDESYINAYFHYNPPKTVSCEDFSFAISDKGGIGGTRNPNLDVDEIKNQLLKEPNKLHEISTGKISIISNFRN
jgi:hypothetical protein